MRRADFSFWMTYAILREKKKCKKKERRKKMIKTTVRTDSGCELEVVVEETKAITITDILNVGPSGVLDFFDCRQEAFTNAMDAALKAMGGEITNETDGEFDPFAVLASEANKWIKVDLKGKGKIYEKVNKIVIGYAVLIFDAYSYQFPNVSSVESASYSFDRTSVSDCGFAGIIYCHRTGEKHLLNVFRRDAVLDISKIKYISTDAFTKDTDISGLVFENVSSDIKFINRDAVIDMVMSEVAKYPELFKKDDDGLYWYGNIIVMAADGTTAIKTGRRDAYISEDAVMKAKYLEMPDDVYCRVPKFSAFADGASVRAEKEVCIHMTHEMSPEFIKTIIHTWASKWGNVSKLISDCDAYSDDDGVLYSKDFKKLIVCPPNIQRKTDIVRIHDGTEIIGEAAFSFVHVSHIIMPDSVKTLESSAFSDCFMESINLSRGLSSIESETDVMPGQFRSCVNLKEITIPSSIKYIGRESFSRCSNLEKVVFEEGSAETIEPAAFYHTRIKSFELPKSCKRIGEAAFPSSAAYVSAYAGTKGVAGGAYCWKVGILGEPALFSIIREDKSRQEIFVPFKALKNSYVRSRLDAAFCRGLVTCELAELVYNGAGDVSPNIKTPKVYDKAKCALTAIVQYGSKDEDIRMYLKKASRYFAEKLIEAGDTKRLSELLSLDVLSTQALEKLLALALEKNRTEMTALIAEKRSKRKGKGKITL